MTHAERSDIDELIDGPVDYVPTTVKTITSFGGADEEKIEGVSLDLSDVHAGVSVYWLAAVFGMSTATVKKKLADCPALKRSRDRHLYDLREAAAYLVKPKGNMERMIKELKPEDLPPKLNSAYWDAKLKYQKWAVQAGELWRTGDVLDVLGEAFNRIRTATQLWQVTIERAHGLTDEQRKLLASMADRLLEETHQALIEMPKSRSTPSLRELDEEEGEAAADA